ncbi:MAG: hypothetical protein UY53_C0013G0010 [Parcubacteria group bacterium GW2011_GWA2_50_10]|nr:MAG: hypothetical protein UY53_C0013G0010 [Parcubacteria group bacterium GW2011_GWA2_50_10]
MIRPTETQETAQRLLSLARKEGAEFAEVMAMQNEFSLKRIRQNQVDQPPAGEQWSIDLALVKGKRRKTVCLDNPLGVEKIIRETMERIDLLPEHEPHVPTEKFASVGQPLSLYDKKTAELSGDRLVAFEKTLCGRKIFRPYRRTGCHVHLFFYSQSGIFDLIRFELALVVNLDDHRALGRVAAGIHVKRPGDPFETFDRGDPFLDGTLFGWLGFFGFNGLFVEHGESFISDKVGQQVMGENITIADDPADNRNKGMGFPFDFEGRPRKKIVLVEQGIAKRALYDSALAAEWGKEATCNALPPSSRSEGAAPFDLVIEGGNTSVEEMIKHSKEPTLWITKLHYPGMKHYQTATMTGVAQHGVFLVENGKVVSPVENVRFEENIPEALKRVEALSESRLVFDPLSPSLPSGVVAPAMKIKQFRFVGSTQRSI